MDTDTLSERLRTTIGSRVPGVAMTIVDTQGIRGSTALGTADLANGTRASTAMVCPWFSMTKIVTVTTAMRLFEQGTLDLDEPVVAHVPAVSSLRPATDAARITPRHLMSHSAGIANPMPVSWIHRPEEPGPELGDLVERLLLKHSKLRSTPGERSSYSNVGTLVLGAAMERAASIPFKDLVAREVLEPLGMSRTGFAYAADAPLATGFHPRWSPMRYVLPRWVVGEPAGRWLALHPFLLDGSPYGGIVGPMDDIPPFLRMHLRDGEIDGIRILAVASATAMRDIAVPGKRYDLGLGWFRPAKQRHADPPFVEHLGGGAGFWNVMRIYPTRGLAVAVMGNATRFDIDAVASLALEA